ncbi:hypothetical protein BBP40_006794 [Aspergillus hancockii]|nr:hypothetical protein BBP40_006794 [Aspergillus hancockii]
MTSLNQSGDINFTVFVRLPFPRGEFAEWNAAKDQALWDLLSRPSKGDDIDWKALAERFEVTLQFLLQQAAWLYDRQLSQVRAQMRKVGTTQSNSPSPVPSSVSGSTALGAQSAKGAPNSVPRGPSRLSSQQNDAIPQRVPPPRRTSSTNTVSQIKPARETPVEPKDPRRESYTRRPSASKRDHVPAPSAPVHKPPTLEEEDPISSSSSSSSSSDEDDGLSSRRGLHFRRPPWGKMSTRPGLRDDDNNEDDDDESPAFLPLPQGNHDPTREPSAPDLSATLRLQSENPRRRTTEQSPLPRASMTTESSASSASSGAPVILPRRGGNNSIPSPLSPRRTDLVRRSLRRSGTSGTSGREGSDDTPSMGSSFSDLDDASVTQSALEEALMSHMQHGGMASRMSTISQAIRSRYL